MQTVGGENRDTQGRTQGSERKQLVCKQAISALKYTLGFSWGGGFRSHQRLNLSFGVTDSRQFATSEQSICSGGSGPVSASDWFCPLCSDVFDRVIEIRLVWV